MKEYVLGVELFDGTASFDPRVDTIVRVEAVKLRKRIQEYYRGPGRKDPFSSSCPRVPMCRSFVCAQAGFSPDLYHVIRRSRFLSLCCRSRISAEIRGKRIGVTVLRTN